MRPVVCVGAPHTHALPCPMHAADNTHTGRATGHRFIDFDEFIAIFVIKLLFAALLRILNFKFEFKRKHFIHLNS